MARFISIHVFTLLAALLDAISPLPSGQTAGAGQQAVPKRPIPMPSIPLVIPKPHGGSWDGCSFDRMFHHRTGKYFARAFAAASLSAGKREPG